LTVVNHHDTTIARAFAYLGYDFEIIDKDEGNVDLIRQRIVASIDAGIPVLGFGIVGPPECSIICGYDDDGANLLGWSHFQSRNADDLATTGMFTTTHWVDSRWRIVLCGAPKQASQDLREIIRHGVKIASATSLGNSDDPGGEEDLYAAGAAAYDAWIAYVSREAYDDMTADELRRSYWFHNTMVGNNAEAKCYLGGFLHDQAGDDAELHRIAGLYDEIHTVSWQIWDVAGGIGNKEAYQSFADAAKRAALAEFIGKMKALEIEAIAGFTAWLAGE